MSELLQAMLGMLDSLGCDFPSNILCKAGFVAIYCLNLFLSWNILFSPLIVNNSLTGYSSLGLHIHGLLVSAVPLSRTSWLSWFP